MFLKKKKLSEFTAQKSERLRNGVNGCCVNSHTELCSHLTALLPATAQLSCYYFLLLESMSFTPVLLYSLLFCSFSSFPRSPVKALELKA